MDDGRCMQKKERMNQTYQLVSCFLSTRGRRSANQDSAVEIVPRDAHVLATQGALFAIADGLGGHNAGNVASSIAAQVLVRSYYQDIQNDLLHSLGRAVQQANHAVWTTAQQRFEYRGMGTTLVAAAVRGNQIAIANVGDSRAYLAREGKIWQLTRDHSFAAELQSRGIYRRNSEHDAWGKTLTRALGQSSTIQVDLYRGTIKPGDKIFLCSDGLSDFVHVSDLARSLNSKDIPAAKAQNLIERAYKKGSRDNITGGVIELAVEKGNIAQRLPSRQTLPVQQFGAHRGSFVASTHSSSSGVMVFLLCIGMMLTVVWLVFLLRLAA